MAEELKKPVTGGSNDVEENKVIALLSYIIFFVPFLVDLCYNFLCSDDSVQCKDDPETLHRRAGKFRMTFSLICK